ncbi:MAG TPA: MFS transporter [Candidatus Saccharimonadales bacterium]|nr:MFS transporter [Candidatus Saccharimonadales bacterium]
MPSETKGLMFLVRALGSRNFRLFFFGQAVSLIGTWMQIIAMRWLVYRLTKSELMLGIVGFISDAPLFLLVPFAGVLVDRLKRHRIMVVTQALSALQAAVLAVLVLTDQVAVWHVFALGGLLGIVSAFDITARQAFIVDIIEDRNDLPNAIALNSFIFNGALLIGPAIAGVLIALVGEGPCFALNSLSYLAVLGALFLMKIPEKTFSASQLDFKAAIMEGAAYTLASVPIRSILILVASVSLVAASYTLLMPVFAEDILHGGPRVFGYLMSATGVGALAGAIFLASRSRLKGLAEMIAVAGAIYGVALVALSFSRLLSVALIIALVLGFSLMMQMASSNTIVQSIVDDQKRGRVLSLFVMARRGVESLGSLLFGAIAHWVGTPATLIIGGATCLLAVAAFATKLSAIRHASHSFDDERK